MRAAGLFCLAALMGCSFKSTVLPESGISSSRVAGITRVYLPSSGGQTIVPPQKMADVTSLWMPLSAQELRHIARRRQENHGTRATPLPNSVTIRRLYDADRASTEEFLFRLTQRQRNVTMRVLARAEPHLPGIISALSSYGLPVELAALPFVESAFEPKAVSPAGAVGLWQLMPATARRFGLVVTQDQDERFDPQKSTDAAMQYLKFLYGHFQDWPIAIAAYNSGEGAMQKVLTECNVSSLAEIISICRSGTPPNAALQEETLSFVPKFAAAVAVMANSQVYALSEQNQLDAGELQQPKRQEEQPLTMSDKTLESRDTATGSLDRPRLMKRLEY